MRLDVQQPFSFGWLNSLMYILLLNSWFWVVPAHATERVYRYYNPHFFQADSAAPQSVFAQETALRAGPGEQYPVVAILHAGDQVWLQPAAPETLQTAIRQGILSYWLPVRDGQNRQGYLLQQDLALITFEQGKQQFLFGLLAIEPQKEADGQFTGDYLETAALRVVVDQQIVAHQTIQLKSWQGGAILTGRVRSGMGLTGVQQLIELEFGAESCGESTLIVTFAWTGKALVALPMRQISGDGLLEYVEAFVFPNEKGGKPDRIIKKQTDTAYVERPRAATRKSIKRKEKRINFLWDGNTFKQITAR